MPVFEPSADMSQKQAELAAILVPVLVMLGGMGLSYGIYTALRWFSSSNRHTESNPGPEALGRTNDPEKLATHTSCTVQLDAQQLSRNTTTSAPPPLGPIIVIGSDGILDTMKSEKKNVDIVQSGKHISANSGLALVVSTGIPAKGKENLKPHMPKQPSPLKNGYKPDGPEPGIHPLHGYHYF
ncbi:hypothetical protein APHAL10511_002501 [Amanita phalloides]|nr:hypothetical protein APHAL10511_002501 [Amanita phalloides]